MSETTRQDLDALREGLRLVEDVYRPALWRPGHEPGHTDLTPEECRLCAMDRALSAVAVVLRRELEALAAGEHVRERVAREIREAAWANPTGLRERQNAEVLADRILALLRTPRGEGEAAHRDGAQGEAGPEDIARRIARDCRLLFDHTPEEDAELRRAMADLAEGIEARLEWISGPSRRGDGGGE